MDRGNILEITEKYAHEVGLKYEIVKFILFGSYAKGNYTENSDIDIAIIFNDYNNLLEMQLDLMRIRRKIDSRIEPHPFRAKDFNISNPLVNEILKYGLELKY